MVRDVTDRVYDRITRCTTNGFIRLKLGHVLAGSGFSPATFTGAGGEPGRIGTQGGRRGGAAAGRSRTGAPPTERDSWLRDLPPADPRGRIRPTFMLIVESDALIARASASWTPRGLVTLMVERDPGSGVEGRRAPGPRMCRCSADGTLRTAAPRRQYRMDEERGLGLSRRSPRSESEPAGTRTQDLLIKSQMLYRLSYRLVMVSGFRGVNIMAAAPGVNACAGVSASLSFGCSCVRNAISAAARPAG